MSESLKISIRLLDVQLSIDSCSCLNGEGTVPLLGKGIVPSCVLSVEQNVEAPAMR